MLLKSLMRGSFSLMVFGWAQILMDIQPLLVMITGKGHLHGFSHTFVGASLIAIVAALSGKPIIDALIRSKRFGFADSDRALLGIGDRLDWMVTVTSAFIGSFSHVYLDALVHADLQPFYPFASSNPWLGVIGFDALHKLCIYLGLVGAGIYLGAQLWLKRSGRLDSS